VAANTAGTITTKLGHAIGSSSGLIPAGLDTSVNEDRPLTHALVDARAQIVAAMTADGTTLTTHRNTIVVLVAGGPNDGSGAYTAANDPVTYVQNSLREVSAAGVKRKITLFVVGVKPSSDTQLKAIAAAGGGTYFEAQSAGDVTRAVNLAVQSGFRRATDVETSTASEFSFVSPVVGTVNLKNAQDATGASLPYTSVQTPAALDIPQRSNVLLTAGFVMGGTLPVPDKTAGFEGRLRAFRTYRPEPDSTKPAGWKFVADGTRLWPDRDGRPSTAGIARTPADPNLRNVFTYVPGVGMIAFNAANQGVLSTYLGAGDPAAVIDFVRRQPLGAIVGSTPAVMDPPLARSAPGRGLRPRRHPRHLCRHLPGPPQHHLGRRQRRDDARHRRTHRLRSVGIHPLQSAAEAEDPARRQPRLPVRVLRRQLPQGRRREAQRCLADAAPVRRGPGRHLLPDARRHRRRHRRPIPRQ
jgi:hypothetical protein